MNMFLHASAYKYVIYTWLLKVWLFGFCGISTFIGYSKSNSQFQCQKTVLFLTIQFSISAQFNSIWPVDRALSSGSTTLGLSGPGSDGNKRVLRIPQNFSISGTSPSDCLMLYPRHLLWEVLPLFREAVSAFYIPSQLGNTQG